MITQLSAPDWEVVSSYLDDQLNPQERAALEVRLQNEPLLQTGLDDLRRTRLLIRSAPKMRAPRNFTLTPSMAGSRRGFRLSPTPYPILGFASMLATLFFVLITAGSLAVRFASPAQTEIQGSEIGNARPALGLGSGGGGAVEPPAMMMAPTEAAVLEGSSESAPLTQGALEVTPLAQDELAPTDGVLQAMPAPQESDITQESLSAKAPPEQASEPPVQTGPVQTGNASRSAWSLVGVLQVFLALLALISGLAALYLRRNSLH